MNVKYIYIYNFFFLHRMSAKKMEETRCVSMKFIVFLKGTLGKMVATNFLGHDFINLKFWQNWPQKFYNIKSYDSTKENFDLDYAQIDDHKFNSQDEEEMDRANQDQPHGNVDPTSYANVGSEVIIKIFINFIYFISFLHYFLNRTHQVLPVWTFQK